MKHTPEPWNLHRCYQNEEPMFVVNEGGKEWLSLEWRFGVGDKIIGSSGADTAKAGWPVVDNFEEMKANARRIVSCVNACAGMEDPEAEIAAMRKQIDEQQQLLRAA